MIKMSLTLVKPSNTHKFHYFIMDYGHNSIDEMTREQFHIWFDLHDFKFGKVIHNDIYTHLSIKEYSLVEK